MYTVLLSAFDVEETRRMLEHPEGRQVGIAPSVGTRTCAAVKSCYYGVRRCHRHEDAGPWGPWAGPSYRTWFLLSGPTAVRDKTKNLERRIGSGRRRLDDDVLATWRCLRVCLVFFAVTGRRDPMCKSSSHHPSPIDIGLYFHGFFPFLFLPLQNSCSPRCLDEIKWK